jgi:integrase
MAHLERRRLSDGSVSWRVIYRVNGLRQVEVLGQVSRKVAEQRRAEVISALALCRDPRRSQSVIDNVTLNDLLLIDEKWCQHRRQPKAMEVSRWAMEKLIRWSHNRNLVDISRGLIESFINHFTDQGLSHTSINICIRSLKAIFSRAVREHRLIEYHPFKDVKPLSVLQHIDKPKFLTVGQIDGILLGIGDDVHFKRLVQFYLLTGCRRTEAIELTWVEVDFKGGHFYLGRSRSKTKRRRMFPMTGDLRRLLEELMKDGNEHDRVFWRFNPGNPSYITRRIGSMRSIAGLPDNLKTHMLRHTFGSHLAMAGVDMTTIANLMGHTTTKVTELYAHLSPAHKMLSASRIPYKVLD